MINNGLKAIGNGPCQLSWDKNNLANINGEIKLQRVFLRLLLAKTYLKSLETKVSF